MQLDKTHVAVRLRTMSEIGDLALVMIRRYPASYLAFAVGVSVWALTNALLLSWIPITEYRYGLDDDEAWREVVRYAFWMVTLVILQAPAAGALMTSYLGQAVFEQTPTWQNVWVETKRHIGRWVWVLGVKRLAIPAMMIVAIRFGQPVSWFWDVTVPILMLLLAIPIRAGRPFLPEILLLERCPLRTDSPTVITASQRSRSLHRPVSGDVSGRFLAVAFVLTGLFFSLFYTWISIRGLMIGLWNLMDLVVLLVLFPLSLWMVAGVSVLIRFLVYLDTRIRLEGWEVELAMQAEAMRQFGDEIGVPSTLTASSRTPLLLIVFVLSLASPLAAQPNERSGDTTTTKPSVVDDALEDSVWFDAEKSQVRPVKVAPQLDDSLNRDSRWLPKPKRIKESAAPIVPGNGLWGTGYSVMNLMGWLLLIVVLGLAVVLIAKVVSNADAHEAIRSGPRSKQQTAIAEKQMAERIKHLPAELRRTDVNLRDESERLMKEGEYDHAIILLFGHQLLLLDHAGLLRLNRGKTNRKYVRETAVANLESAELLRATVDTFERSYFGRHRVSETKFRELWRMNTELEKAIKQTTEVAA